MGAKPFSFCHKSRVIQTYIQTHRQTDRTLVAIPRLHSMQHGKKQVLDTIIIIIITIHIHVHRSVVYNKPYT